MEARIRRHGDAQFGFESADLGAAIHQRAAIRPLDDLAGLDLVLLRNVAGDRFENIGQRHHTLECAEFVEHEGEMVALLAEELNHIEHRGGVRHENRLAQGPLDIEGLALQQLVEQILLVHEAERLIDGIALGDDHAAIGALAQFGSRHLGIIRHIDPVDRRTAGHDLRYRAVGKADHLLHHRLLGRVDDAGLRALLEHRLDFLFRHAAVALLPDAKGAQDERCRGRKQVHEGARQRRDEAERARDASRDGLGMGQRDALRHEFPQNNRKEGDAQDNDAVADRLGVGGDHRVFGKRIAEFLAERHGAEGA